MEYLTFVGNCKGFSGKKLKEEIQRVMEVTQITHMKDRLIGHLSKVVKPGAVRVQTKLPHLPQGLMCSAFVNPDKSIAFVCMNEANHPIEFSVSANGKDYVNYTIPARAVSSFQW